MTPNRVAIIGLSVCLAVACSYGVAATRSLAECGEQRDYAISRRTEAERSVEYHRQLANTWEKLSGTNESLARANSYRAEACERLMNMKEAK